MTSEKKQKINHGQGPKANWFSLRITHEEVTVDDFKSWVGDYATDWWFQVERGEKAHKRHFQALIYVKERQRDTAIAKHFRACDDRVTDMNVSPLTKGKRATALKRYTGKCPTRIEGPFSSKPIYMGKDVQCVEHDPLPMQKMVLDMMAEEPDDRRVVYIWEPVGNIGKSKLVKYVCWRKMAKYINTDSAARLTAAICKAGAFRCYMIDLTRSKDAAKSIGAVFEVIERLKNGHIADNMYGEDNELFMESPHVFVFANFPPDMSSLSKDRWDIWGPPRLKALAGGDASPVAAAGDLGEAEG